MLKVTGFGNCNIKLMHSFNVSFVSKSLSKIRSYLIFTLCLLISLVNSTISALVPGLVKTSFLILSEPVCIPKFISATPASTSLLIVLIYKDFG